MILDPVTITINNSYDWNAWEKALIEKCIHDNPSSILNELAGSLNMSERTLYRKVIKHGIDVSLRKPEGHELYCNLYRPSKKN